MYTVKIEKFEGPLSLLLKLIEQEKMDIAEISLLQVTDQYLAHVDSLGAEVHPSVLADFLVVAARLLVIKSRALLPSLAPEEGEPDELERQLRMYKAYRDAAELVRGAIKAGRFSYGRQQYRLALEREFRPPERLTLQQLRRSFTALIAELEQSITRLPKKSVARIVTIGERIEHLRALLSRAQSIGFADFLKTARNKSEIVVSFLALLEMVKQRKLVAVQDNGNIMIQRNEAG